MNKIFYIMFIIFGVYVTYYGYTNINSRYQYNAYLWGIIPLGNTNFLFILMGIGIAIYFSILLLKELQN